MEPRNIDHATPSDWDNLAKLGVAPKSYVKPTEPIKQEQVLQKSESMVGAKFDSDKDEWHLLPNNALRFVIRVLMFGKNKYTESGWREVPDAKKRYLNAAMRHITAVIDGQWVDEESKLPHLAHAACCLLFILALHKD